VLFRSGLMPVMIDPRALGRRLVRGTLPRTRTGVLISTSAAYAVEQVELLAAQPESTGGDVLLQVCRIAGTGDGEYMITLVQCPRQADLGRRRTVRLRHRGDLRLSRLRSEEHTSELQSRENLVCRLLLEKKKI